MDKKLYPRIGEEVIWVTLDNGLPVCIVPKKGFSRKYALFATRYGGMDMRFRLNGQWLDTPAGIAHYLEHKMFDTEDGNALQELAMNGAEPNAFTSNAITCYYFDSTEKFYENLEILLSFVSVPYFTDESVEKEQGIIGQEIGMIEDNPEWQVYKQLMQSLYHTSPARTPVAGSKLVKADLTVTNASGELYADDALAEKVDMFASGSLALETDDKTDEVHAAIHGATKDTQSSEVTDSDGDVAPRGGLCYYKVIIRGGVRYFKGVFHPLVKAILGNDSAATKGSSITFGTSATTFTVFRCNSGAWRTNSAMFG